GDRALEIRHERTVLFPARRGVFARFLGPGCRASAQHLVVSAAVAVDSDTLALHIIRELVDLANVINSRGVREISSLGNGRVAVLLEGSLHLDVPLGSDRFRGDEAALPLLWHFGVFDRAGLGDT